MANVLDIEFLDMEGNTQTLRSLGSENTKKWLVVNVASRCGLTRHYTNLQAVSSMPDVLVVGFPCNQFGGQEPGSDQEIGKFCDINYSVTFPIFSKIKVNGPEAHPLFKLLKSDKPGIFRTQSIKWNFTKFLINNNGKIVERFSPRVEPKYIRKEIEKVL